ncbi:MAG: response regulator transcription factor [Magnetococcales bacterium]|nr:response regulator transcription factor [Magnetococcales bacterium]
MRVLIVEDDPALSRRLKQALSSAGFAGDVVDNGHDAEWMGLQTDYQAAVLDLGLPGQSGLLVLKAWRRRRLSLPVLILSARDAWHQRVEGFHAGADDYLGKPFHMDELIARLQALIRRTQTGEQGAVQSHGFILDEQRQSVEDSSGTTHELTGMEFRLLRCFMLRPDAVLSKDVLIDQLYHHDADAENATNTVEVYINRLRKKLGRESIRTKWGQGYHFRGNRE